MGGFDLLQLEAGTTSKRFEACRVVIRELSCRAPAGAQQAQAGPAKTGINSGVAAAKSLFFGVDGGVGGGAAKGYRVVNKGTKGNKGGFVQYKGAWERGAARLFHGGLK